MASSTLILVAAALALGITILLARPSKRDPFRHPRLPPRAKEGIYPVLGAVRYFTDTWDWHCAERARVRRADKGGHNPFGAFAFRLGSAPIIALTGAKGRELAVSHPNLDIHQGYALLHGVVADTTKSSSKADQGVEVDVDTGVVTTLAVRRLKTLVTGRHLLKGTCSRSDAGRPC